MRIGDPSSCSVLIVGVWFREVSLYMVKCDIKTLMISYTINIILS